MSIEIKWIGHASFRIAGADSVVYIDPWKLPEDIPGGDADVVFVSHGHYDHCSPPDVEKVSREGTVVIAPADAAGQLAAACAVRPGDRKTVGNVTVEAVAAYNIGKAFHPKENGWLGAVVALGGVRVYYAGDTDLIPEMSELRDVDVALLPVGGTYTLDAAEAVRACREIGCKAVIGYHWGDIVGSAADAQALADGASCKAYLLQPGQAVTI